MAPSEFWKLSPADWWALWDINVGELIREKTSTMDRLKRIYHESKAQEKVQAKE